MKNNLKTVCQVAQELGVSEKTIYRAIKSKKLKATRLGGTMIRIDELHLLEYINGGRGAC